MEMKTSSLILIAFVLAILASVLLKISEVGKQHFSQITTYAECVTAGNPIMESYPTQCRTADGRTFVNPEQHVDVPTQAQPELQQYVQNGCAVAGCSGEICTDEAGASDIASSCVYLPIFVCYKTARCERQADAKCGWSQTAELQACLAAAPKINMEPLSD